MKQIENKWFWMMDYCKKSEISPAQDWAWFRAEVAWELFMKY